MDEPDPSLAAGPSRIPASAGGVSVHDVSPGTGTSARPPQLSPTRSPESARDANKRPRDPQRSKNLQACDRCRLKKIKCVPVDSTRDACQSCHGAHIACTFDLPLTASRTKRVRRGLGLEAAPGSQSHYEREDDELGREETPDGPKVPFGLSPADLFQSMSPGVRGSGGGGGNKPHVHREGQTSISYILHSMPTVPLRALDEFDRSGGLAMRAFPEGSGDGWIDVSTSTSLDTPPAVHEALRSESWGEVASRLVEKFLAHVSPLIPIVTRIEVSSAGDPLLHAMAAVVAARSSVPPVVFDALRHLVKCEIEDNDVLSIPTRENVQVLLSLALVDELAVKPGIASASQVARSRLAAAIRHARDLGIDRATSGTDARIWRCARVIDIWHAARSGMTLLIPVDAIPSSTPGDDFFAHLYVLSLILGRLIVVMYGPMGAKNATSEQLSGVRDALDQWRDGLPQNLKATGLWPGQEAGLLHLLYTGIRWLLYRPVMRWSFIVPQRFELNCDVPAWLDLLAISRTAIDWATTQEEVGDILFFGPYALSLVCMIQYHTWARRGEWDGAVLLDKARREAVNRWLARIPEGHLPLLRRSLAPIELLYNITQTHREQTAFDGPRGLNPTPGILNRLPEASITGVTWLRDDSLPQGGVLVASQKAAREIRDLPPGTIVIGGPPPPGPPPGAEDSNRMITATSSAPGVTPNGAFTPSDGYFTGLLGDPSVVPAVERPPPGWDMSVREWSDPALTPTQQAAMASFMFPTLGAPGAGAGEGQN